MGSKLLQHFDVEGGLGCGGFGVVLKCRHKIDKKGYAIKAVLPKEEFEREIQNLVKIPSHRNLVEYKTCWRDTFSQEDLSSLRMYIERAQIFQAGLPSSVTMLCIQMELCTTDLRNWLNQEQNRKTLNEKSRTIFHQICNGIQHIHENNVIHRDMKPDNVFLIEDQSSGLIAKVGDLGLGTAHTSTNSVRHTRDCGTLLYLAPEQVGSKYGRAVDIFALGIILMELFCPELQPRYNGGEFDELQNAIAELKLERVVPPSIKRDEPKIAELVLKMTDPKSSNRPSFGEILQVIGPIKQKEVLGKIEEITQKIADFSFSPVKNSEYIKLLMELRERGSLKSKKLEGILLKMDRAKYVKESPYVDRPQPIGCSVNISAPHMHAMMLEEVVEKLQNGGKALDIGSGSGYVTACMALMVGPRGKVIGIDHMTDLVDQSLENINKDKPELLKHGVVSIIVGDGRKGYELEAPYDVIHIGAACETIPDRLVSQLKDGGRLVAPIGHGDAQKLKVIDKIIGSRIRVRDVCGVRFALLTSQQGQLS